MSENATRRRKRRKKGAEAKAPAPYFGKRIA